MSHSTAGTVAEYPMMVISRTLKNGSSTADLTSENLLGKPNSGPFRREGTKILVRFTLATAHGPVSSHQVTGLK